MKTSTRPDGTFAIEVTVEPHSMVTVVFTRHSGPLTCSVATSTHAGQDFRIRYFGEAPAINVSATSEAEPETERDPKVGAS